MKEKTPPPEFIESLYSLRNAAINGYVKVEETSAPTRLAPFTAAVALECESNAVEQGGSGRFIVLYDPSQRDIWGGDFRLVVMLHAHVDPDLTCEDMIDQVAWSWMHDCLVAAGAGYRRVAGTVTKTQSSSFGELKYRVCETKLEIRASWTPNTTDIGPHLTAISSLLCILAGQPVDINNMVGISA